MRTLTTGPQHRHHRRCARRTRAAGWRALAIAFAFASGSGKGSHHKTTRQWRASERNSSDATTLLRTPWVRPPSLDLMVTWLEKGIGRGKKRGGGVTVTAKAKIWRCHPLTAIHRPRLGRHAGGEQLRARAPSSRAKKQLGFRPSRTAIGPGFDPSGTMESRPSWLRFGEGRRGAECDSGQMGRVAWPSALLRCSLYVLSISLFCSVWLSCFSYRVFLIDRLHA